MLLCMQTCTVVTATLWYLAGMSWSADTTQKPLNPKENNNEGSSIWPAAQLELLSSRVRPMQWHSSHSCAAGLCTLSCHKHSRNRTESVFDLAPISLDSHPVRHSWDIMELWMLLHPTLPDTQMPRVYANFPRAGWNETVVLLSPWWERCDILLRCDLKTPELITVLGAGQVSPA